ncbi:MAG: hypothetical protein ABTD50_15705 [Polyangiaceae bacterium]|jgi:hypothetical protein
MVKVPIVPVAVALVAVGCKPDLTDRLSLIDGPRILAVQSQPAEAAPKAQVMLTALMADPTGTVTSAAIDWAFCNQPKPLAELGTVSPLCLQTQGAWFTDVGNGVEVQCAIPDIGCREFGPSVPVAQAGQPPGRPVDPDTTGGYYQPVRLWAAQDGLIAIGETRLSCGLAGGTAAQSTQFAKQYLPNTNPAVAMLVAQSMTSWSADDSDAGASNNVAAVGSAQPLQVSWATCPVVGNPPSCGDAVCGPDPSETAATCKSDCPAQPCTGAEEYLNLDLASATLVIHREGMQVAWYATAGTFDDDSTGRDQSDLTTSSDNVWHAPSQPGPVHLWVVLQDDRGGSGWESYTISVQ